MPPPLTHSQTVSTTSQSAKDQRAVDDIATTVPCHPRITYDIGLLTIAHFKVGYLSSSVFLAGFKFFCHLSSLRSTIFSIFSVTGSLRLCRIKKYDLHSFFPTISSVVNHFPQRGWQKRRAKLSGRIMRMLIRDFDGQRRNDTQKLSA